MKTTIQLAHEATGHPDRWVVRALLKVQGEPPAGNSRVPLNLSVVLDRSGSMQGEKLEAAKEAAALLVRRLWPDDRVSVVAYDDSVITVAPPATGDGQLDLSRRIAGIRSGGCTNLSGGWLRGRELVATELRPGGVNRVLLLTDGLANVGITDHAQLEGLCRTAAVQGIRTTTIGFGADYDERLLQAMADAGAGHTYYIERPDQAPGIFAEEIEGLLGLTTQNVTVEVRPSPAVREAMAHHDYPSTESGSVLRLELGDVYAREPRPLLLEFVLTTTGDPGVVDVAELIVEGHVLTADGGVVLRTLRLPIRLDLAEGPRADPEVQRELALLEAAKKHREALRFQEEGDFESARFALREVVRRYRTAPEVAGDLDVMEELADLAAMAESLDDWSPADRKYLHQVAYDSEKGRRFASRRIRRKKQPEEGEKGGS